MISEELFVLHVRELFESKRCPPSGSTATLRPTWTSPSARAVAAAGFRQQTATPKPDPGSDPECRSASIRSDSSPTPFKTGRKTGTARPCC